MTRFLFDIAALEVEHFLSALTKRTQQQIIAGGVLSAERLEAQAKREAPWTDRTGMARATIAGINGFDDDVTYCIGVCGNMHYSPELERGYNRRYEVLVPVLRKNADRLLDDIRSVISRQEGLS